MQLPCESELERGNQLRTNGGGHTSGQVVAGRGVGGQNPWVVVDPPSGPQPPLLGGKGERMSPALGPGRAWRARSLGSSGNAIPTTPTAVTEHAARLHEPTKHETPTQLACPLRSRYVWSGETGSLSVGGDSPGGKQRHSSGSGGGGGDGGVLEGGGRGGSREEQKQQQHQHRQHSPERRYDTP